MSPLPGLKIHFGLLTHSWRCGLLIRRPLRGLAEALRAADRFDFRLIVFWRICQSNAWKTLARDKTFGGMTYDQFEAATAPSFTTRQQLEENDDQRTQLLTARAGADEVSLAKLSLVVNGVRADPNFGDDSGLIEAMGYTRASERKSGLTRKAGSKKPPTP